MATTSERGVSVFCVDDDPFAIDDLRAALGALGPAVEARFFGSPEDALQAHRAAPADIVIADLRLGALSGIDLIVDMQAIAPGSIYMLISGAADLPSAFDAVNRTHVLRFLPKPVRAGDLQSAISEARDEIALRARRRLADLSMAAVEQARLAVAVLDAGFRVVYANEDAARIIREGDGFSLGPKEELRGAGPEETARLHAFLRAAAGRERDDVSSGAIRIPRGEGRLPIILSVRFVAGSLDADTAFHLLLADPERKAAPSAEEISGALGLSPSEARVVHGLVLGMDVAEAAENAGVSLSTARTYIKNSFSKTGVTRQAELVRLALLTAA